MYQVLKVLNNNGIVARCLATNKEYIFLGKGIGFSKKMEDTFESIQDAKIYRLQEAIEQEDRLSVLNNVDPIFLDIANEIVLLAEEKLGSLDNRILLPLADHISFSIERIKNGLDIKNPLNTDIKILFSEEYEVARQSVEIIQKYTGYLVSEDEVGYITMHLHSALAQDHIRKSMSIVFMVEKFIESLESNYRITIDKDSLSYTRLLTHIKYMIVRALNKESLHVDITPYVKAEFSQSYEMATELCQLLGEDLGCIFTETEISYLAVHIERVRRTEEHE